MLESCPRGTCHLQSFAGAGQLRWAGSGFHEIAAMHVVVTAVCFLAAFLTTWFRGAGSALAFVYLPALLLVSLASTVHLPLIPDVTPPTACIYGILIGGLLAGRWPRLRLSLVDCIVAFLLLAYLASAVVMDGLREGLNIFGAMFLGLAAPYFIVRCTLEERRTQREVLFVLVAMIAIVAFFAMIEVRLWPFFYLRQLTNLGIAEFAGGRVTPRFNFFRANSSFLHPIDLGISAGLVLAAIFLLANRARLGTRNTWVRLGLGMALAALAFSLSFTPFVGFAVGACLYVVLSRLPWSRRFLVPGVAILILLVFAYLAMVASSPLPEQPPGDGAFEKSLWTRHLVFRETWQLAATAGPLGRGSTDVGAMTALKRSVDSAYLLIAIERGWVVLGLWLSLPVCLAAMVSRVLRRPLAPRLVRSMLAGFSACIGTMLAMVTVWFGFVYSSLLMVMIALTVNAAQAARTSHRSNRNSRSSGRVPRHRPSSLEDHAQPMRSRLRVDV